MARRVLITGGAGFVGANLARHLLAQGGYAVAVLDNLSVGQETPDLPPAAEFRRGDFIDAAVMRDALAGVDTLVHLAALSGVVDSIADPVPSFEVNVAGTFRLLELARQAKIGQVIFASTGGALLGEVPPPISETMAPSPLSPYGATKLAIEGYCSAYAGAYGLACTALRFSNLYGPYSAHKKSVVASFIKTALRDETLIVYGDGSQRRDYLYVGDLVRGIERAMAQRATGTFQLGSGTPSTLIQLVAALESIAGRRLPLRFESSRRGEVHSTWCDIGKAAATFGFAAPTDLAAGLRATWSWFAANRAAWINRTTLVSAD